MSEGGTPELIESPTSASESSSRPRPAGPEGISFGVHCTTLEKPMKCEGCGADLVEGAKTCTACGRAVGLGQRAAGETAHVAKETGVVAGKLGRGLVGGVKGLGAGAKKGFKGSDEEKKE